METVSNSRKRKKMHVPISISMHLYNTYTRYSHRVEFLSLSGLDFRVRLLLFGYGFVNTNQINKISKGTSILAFYSAAQLRSQTSWQTSLEEKGASESNYVASHTRARPWNKSQDI